MLAVCLHVFHTKRTFELLQEEGSIFGVLAASRSKFDFIKPLSKHQK